VKRGVAPRVTRASTKYSASSANTASTSTPTARRLTPGCTPSAAATRLISSCLVMKAGPPTRAACAARSEVSTRREQRARLGDARDLAPARAAKLDGARHQRRRAFGQHALLEIDVVLEPDARVAAPRDRQVGHRQLVAPDAG